MTAKDWCKACRALAERHEAVSDPSSDALKDMLGELYDTMLAAPWAIRASYASIDEARLAAASASHLARVEHGSLAWANRAIGADRSLMALAIQIRTVDALLEKMNDQVNRRPSLSVREWRTTDRRHYVVPSRRVRDLGSSAGDALSYGRRGTLHHRVIPTVIDGMSVRIVPVGLLEPDGREADVHFGAALFPDLALKTVPTPKGFRASSESRPDLSAAILEQVKALSSAHAIVWPELTIDDGALEAVSAALASRAMDDGGALNAVVAGSWHRPRRDGRIGNVAPLLDGTGERIGEYSKIVRFQHGKLGAEDIANGNELVVLVCDRFLAAVAICKDFCDLGESPPWGLLDVDVVLVPSMGNGSTMAGHLANAGRNRIHGDQRALIVQQGLPVKEEDPKGFAVMGDRTLSSDPSSYRCDVGWRLGSI